jgi:UDP-galactopyranose mutase
LVVGAGFAGATAARELAMAGIPVQVIDVRPHIAGNAYDVWHPAGVRVHEYGPHLFHTSNMRVVNWLSQFTRWIPYEHRVTAQLPNADPNAGYVPLPVNRQTLEAVFERSFPTEASACAYVSTQCEDIANPANAREYLYARLGTRLTDLFFVPYTQKMWGHDLAEMDASVVKRISIGFGDEDRYFPNDSFQALPQNGYTALIENMLDHDLIKVTLGQAFDHGMRRDYCHSFLCAPIDVIFENRFGALPYRSIRFHHASISRDKAPGTTAVINSTDHSPFTRTTYWHRLPQHSGPGGTGIATTEEPCTYEDNNNERYYPIQTSDGRFQKRYAQYLEFSRHSPDLTFIGRCGTYRYLDMDQVVNQTQAIVRKKMNRPGFTGE